MTLSENLKNNSVKVNNGSGVVVNTISKEYSYVLTCAHTLVEKDAENKITDSKGNNLKILSINRHPKYTDDENYDCAIIQVEYVSCIRQFTLDINSLEYNANMTLVGYPGEERQTDNSFKQYNGKMVSNNENFIVVNLDGSPSHENIEGMSGGGIYYIQENIPYLVGIEYRMDNTPEDQQYNRIRGRGLKIFLEIITSQQLKPIAPPFLECFSRFNKDIFKFNVVEPNNIKNLQVALLQVADRLVTSGMPSPYELMEKYKNDLLISYENPSEIEERDLWIAYFEFLIICVLIDDAEKIDLDYIKGLERKRRILYSNSDRNWIGRLREILTIARRILDERGTLVIVTPEKGADLLPEDFQVDKVIPNISTVPNSGSFIQINSPQSNEIYKSFVLRHYVPLTKECVVKKEEEFANLNGASLLLQYFRDSFNEIIK
ncbi:serine protease [Acinetobacter baumannii]|nr:serine protease [Acinetobacter baumannii]